MRGNPSVGRNAPSTRRCGNPLRHRPLGQVGVDALARDDQRRKQADMAAAILAHQPRDDGVIALRLDHRAVFRAVLDPQLLVKQPQEVIDLGQRGDGALAPAAAGPLFDGDRRRDAVDAVDIRSRRRLDELPGIGVERFQVAALALAEDDVERQGGLAAAGDAGDHGHAVARNLDVDVLEVVLARPVDQDRMARPIPQRALQRTAGVGAALCQIGIAGDRDPGRRLPALRSVPAGRPPRCVLLPLQCACVVAQGCAGGGVRMSLDRIGRAGGDHQAAAVAALRTEVDDPVAGPDDVEIVLDHQQRVAGGDQLAQGPQQPGHVLEMQAGRRLVEKEQRAGSCRCFLPDRGGACRAAALLRGGLGQEAGKLEPLGFATGQGRHRLAQSQVVEPDVGQRLQANDDLAVRREERQAPGAPSTRGFRRWSGSACGRRRWRRCGPRSRSPGSPAGSACRRNRGSAGRRPTGTASRRVRSRCRRKWGSGRRRS